jgi:glycerophosphoryl diester phosphodiesterase
MRRFIYLPLLLAACAPMTQRTALPSFDKQGHRGCRGLMPENTEAAMIRALELGVTTLEMDVVITADDKVVLSHEPFFSHEISTTPEGKPVSAAEEKRLNIYRMPYAEVKRFDVGLRPHPRFPRQLRMAAVKPLLGEVIDSVAAWCRTAGRPFPFLNVETKSHPATDLLYHPRPEEFTRLVLEVLQSRQVVSQTILQSFDPRTLVVAHRLEPKLQTALLIEGYDKQPMEQQLKLLGFTPSIYSPAYELVNEELVKACHRKGMRLIPWTVNDEANMRRLRGLGVDGIITDYPDLFSSLDR